MKAIAHLFIAVAVLTGGTLPADAQTVTRLGSSSQQETFTLGPTAGAALSTVLDAALVPDPKTRAHSPIPEPLPLPKYGRWVSITKWVSLASAVGLGAAGVVVSNDADKLFERLDTLCNDEPDNCRDRNPDGSYGDPRLESLYQDVISKDRLARAAFIGAEVSFGASVVLFIVDFQKGHGPGNIPYEPESQQAALGMTVGPSEIALRYYFD